MAVDSEMQEDPLDILGTAKENVKITKEQKQQRDRDLNDLRFILSKAEGRRFIWKLLAEAGIFRASFTQNSNQTAFQEGQRDRGLALLQQVNMADINAFALMQREYLSELNSKKLKENK